MKKDIKPFLFFSIIASLLVGHLANRTALIFEGLTGNLVENINAAIDAIIPALQNNPFMIGTSKTALISGAIGAACVWLIFLYNVFGAKNFMRGSEHGSARWGTAKDIKPLTDREPDMNIPLSATEQISVRKVKDFEADRNKNIVVVGGSGSGKTYSEIKPSLMQLHSSYVITDPKGTILPETGYLFTNNGYTVRSFNTIDFSKSLHYNPLAYIHKEKDILKVVTVLMENTNGEGTGSGEKFWKDCEKLLYTALIAYLWYEAPPEDQNIPMMIEMLDICIARFIEIYVYIAISPIPIATFPSDDLNQIAKGFLKSFAAVCLQGAFIYLILSFFPILVSSNILGDTSAWGLLLYSLILALGVFSSSRWAKSVCNAM